jgi:hypothetical protein
MRILMIFLLLFVVFLLVGCVGQKKDIGSFADCLTEQGAVLYGASWCGHCQNQKVIFGDNFDKINYIECTEEKETCESAGIKGYPSWKLNGKIYAGSKTLEKLSAYTGCTLYE